MKILVPLNDLSFLERFIDAGADELYLGFYDEEWTQNFGDYADINRMSGFKKLANQHSFSEAMLIVQRIKKMGCGAFITMNANCYSHEQLAFIEKKYIPQMIESKVDGIIVSDINLALLASKYELPTVSSTMCAIYNSDLVEVYKQTGMRRMILPRDLSLEEISDICSQHPEIEYEVFHMRNGCIFSDCYCLGMHRTESGGSTCGFSRLYSKETSSDYSCFYDIHDMDINNVLYNTMFRKEACALCAIYRMMEIGISSLKIVGRADIYEIVCEEIALTKKNIEIARHCKNEKEYLEKMIFPKTAPKRCRYGFSCYYPEVRFGNNGQSDSI